MTREIGYLEALNEALLAEMARDSAIVLVGENIRGGFRPETKDIEEVFGPNRIIDMPISEAAMTGIATGAALAGARPVVHFQVSSLIFPAFDQLVNQAAKLPLMLGGQGHIAATYLVMGCGASGGRAGQHSDSPHAYLVHAGIKSVAPATPADAKGLTITALREPDPVAIFVPAIAGAMRGPVDEAAEPIPLGQGAIRREGRDVTIVAVGHLVADALAVAGSLAGGGIEALVWDPRSLLPLDREGLAAAVAATGRVVIYDDSARTCGIAAELAATIAERCHGHLKAPLRRVTRADVTLPYSAPLEAEVLPGRRHLEEAVRKLLAAA